MRLQTCRPDSPNHGSSQKVNISHRVTPYIHTSEACEKEPTRKLSGAHLDEKSRPTHQLFFHFSNYYSSSNFLLQSLLPSKRDPPVGGHDIMVFLLVQASHQTKVADLHQLLRRQQHVSRCQVPVDEPAALQVLHPGCNLSGEEPEAQQRVVILS